MMKHILVTLDGSELAETALTVARRLIAPHGTLTLLSVVDIPDMTLYGLYDIPMLSVRDEHQQSLNKAQHYAREYLQRTAKHAHLPEDVTVQIEVFLGDAAAVIVERAQMLRVDAIVMSTHGRTGMNRWLFGSITQRVLGLMPCPVMVVPGLKPADVPLQTSQDAPVAAS